MITALQSTSLQDLIHKPVLFDANIFMVAIDRRKSDKNYSFENMKQLYITPLFESFKKIYVHEEVYNELDDEMKALIDSYIGVNVTKVKEDDLYGRDPKYTTIFNHIAQHELVNYKRGQSKNRGEIYSLAYAAHHNINYFCSKEIMVELISSEIEDLKDIVIITFDIILLIAYVSHTRKGDKTKSKALKSIYKEYCEDVIRRHKLPGTLSEYIKANIDYL